MDTRLGWGVKPPRRTRLAGRGISSGMQTQMTAITDLVLLGGGHAHVEVLRRFIRRKPPDTRITVIAREAMSPYSGMLPGVIRGDYTPAEAHVDLAPLAHAAGARLIVREADGIDLATRCVTFPGRPPIAFDLLSLDVGGQPAMPEGPGIPVKPIGRLLERLAKLETVLLPGARIAIVGAGAGGTELALALAVRLAGRITIVLVSADAEPLPSAPRGARAHARAALVAARVELVSGVVAGAHVGGKLALSDGSFLDVEAVLWATGVVAPAFLARAGLACDAAGCVLVDRTLRSISDSRVFAAGDCATIEGAPRPKAGVWAVRAGPKLHANLARALLDVPPRSWRPQRDALAILGLGGGHAVAWWHGKVVAGTWVKRWKDQLDRRWMRRYAGAERTSVSVNAQPARAPRGEARVVTQVTHVRGSVVDDPFALGAYAAEASVRSLTASGARPWTAHASVVTPPDAGRVTDADLDAALAGIDSVLGPLGCEPAIGHIANDASPGVALFVLGTAG